MKTSLGTEVGLGLGHIVLDGDPAAPAKGTQEPPPFLADVYCGHSRPSQLVLSSCSLYCHNCADGIQLFFFFIYLTLMQASLTYRTLPQPQYFVRYLCIFRVDQLELASHLSLITEY